MRILSIKGLSKKFLKSKVLNDITFSINKGEIVSLVGPNGSGKTTLMKCIAGLLNYTDGIVNLNDLSIYDNREKYLSYISCIIEKPTLYEELTGYDNINFIRNINNISNSKLNDILTYIDIGDKINSKVKTYSLGQKQRLALGIALIKDIKLLVLDEPTNGLDPLAVLELKKLLIDLAKKKGVSILISSHILSDLEEISDRVVFIKNGNIREISEQCIKNNYTNITLTVDNAKNIYSLIMNYNIDKEISIIDNYNLNIKIKSNLVSTLLNNLSKDNIFYNNIKIMKSNLENIYKKLYGEDNYV